MQALLQGMHTGWPVKWSKRVRAAPCYGGIRLPVANHSLQSFLSLVADMWGNTPRHFIVQGHLDTYRFCDEVWTFLVKDVTFKLDDQSTLHAQKVKIVGCNSKRPGEA